MKRTALFLLVCVLAIGIISPAWAETVPAAFAASKAVSKPTSLKATASSENKSIQLTWNGSGTDGISYEIQRKSGSGWNKLATVSQLTYVDSGLKANTKYSYRIRAIQGNDKSEFVTISAKTKNPITSLKLNKKTATVAMGSTLTLKATINPAKATDNKLTWTSSNVKIAKISNGKVTPVALGTATITVTSTNGKSASCEITVKETDPQSVSLDKTKATILVGSTLTLKATVKPTGANKTITWSSGNESVAKVSKDGVVTALKAGTAKITAKTANGKKAICTVTVKTRVDLGANDLKFYFSGQLKKIPSTFSEAKKVFKNAELEYAYGDNQYALCLYTDYSSAAIYYGMGTKKFEDAQFDGKDYKTYRGIKSGDTLDKLLSVYGIPNYYYIDYSEDISFLYKFKTGGTTYYLMFGFERDEDIIDGFYLITEKKLGDYIGNK